jgi:sn-1 stearoyl-lipid 9-desaturase
MLDKKFTGFMVFIHSVSLLAFFPQFFCWSAFCVFLVLYFLTASVGVCGGYHRYLGHRTFMAPQWFDWLIVFLGSLSCQHGPIRWVSQHRAHHRYSDTKGDPHNAKNGFFYSHIGWMLYENRKFDNDKGALDICSDDFYKFLDKYYILNQVILGVILFIIGGLPWVVWGIFVRLVAVYHATWLINSACHKFGYRNYNVKDTSTNNWFVNWLTFGEGNHNNHHRNPKVAKSSERWFEFDPTYGWIWLMGKLGIISNIKKKNNVYKW